MTVDDPGMPVPSELDKVRALVAHATQAMLGDTIAVTDEEWAAPSRLPDWTRAHVATHVARQAEAVVRLTNWARTGQREDMYASNEQRDADIEAGVGRSGLDLQIDLDTASGQLGDAFESLDDAEAWDNEIELRGGQVVKARLLPLARLTEVVLHHVDLDVGVAMADLDAKTAEWVLEWCAYRFGARDGFPALQLTSDSGFSISLGQGSDADRTQVTGSSANLLGWLTGRSDVSMVSGAEQISLPPL